MDKDEKLRQEISMLSHLIASNESAPRSRGIPATFNHHQYRGHPYQRIPLVVSHALPSRGRGGPSVYRYTNSFRSPVPISFPGSYLNGFTRPGSGSNQSGSSVSYADVGYSEAQSPYQVAQVRAPCTEVSFSSKAPLPKSVHINPAHLVSSSSIGVFSLPNTLVSTSTTTTTSSSFKIRPHINPEHLAYQQLCNNVPATVISTTSSSATTSSQSQLSMYGYRDPSVVTNAPLIDRAKGQEVEMNSDSNPRKVITTKYKVDRRLKPSPTKATAVRALHTKRTKIVKKYSTRFVSQSTPGHLSLSKKNVYQHSPRKSSLLYRKQFQKSWKKLFGKPTGRSPKLYGKRSHVSRQNVPGAHSPKKSVVRIGENNYIRKNSGRTLKRIKQGSPAVVNIGGNNFISKKGGKSLKRLCNTSKMKRNSISHSHTSDKRLALAQRAVCKSKLTLSQRTWKKKRLCVFYNRLGECKKNQEGKCPFVHDRTQLTICPKFIVGKCTVADCKLSHDLKCGRMPPCQFFNKSNCSRENCPYPHIKSTSSKNKSPKTDNIKCNEDGEQKNAETPATPRKRKLSIKKASPSPKNSKKRSVRKQSSGEKDKPTARYYEQFPDSQPVVTIIPRRLRPEAEPPMSKTETDVKQKPIDGSQETNPVNAVQAEANQLTNSTIAACNTSSSNTSCDTKVLQRARLMMKVSRLQEKVKPKESSAPQFLPFS